MRDVEGCDTSCMNVLNGPLIYSQCLVSAHNLYLHWKFIVLYSLQMASEALKKRGHVYRCAECPYAGDRRQFETHYVTKHADGDDVPFLCKECGLRFVGMILLNVLRPLFCALTLG